MSTFVKEACKFVQAMLEPILVDGLSGKVSAEVLDGYIDIWVPVSKRDQRRLEPNYWAFNALIQTLAQVLASELPDGVTSDAIAIRLLPPGTRSRTRARLQQARQTQHSHQLPAEILGMTVEELLRRLGAPLQSRWLSPIDSKLIMSVRSTEPEGNESLSRTVIAAPVRGDIAAYKRITAIWDSNEQISANVRYSKSPPDGDGLVTVVLELEQKSKAGMKIVELFHT